jgi:hypothetical protein
MKSTLTRVLAAAGVAVLLAAAVPGGAGAATLPKPTAKVDVHQVVAGAQQPFALTVSNPVGAARITSVRITAAAGLFTIAAPVDVAGWTGVVKNGFLTFTAGPGGGIAGGVSKAFGFVADAQRPAHDENAAWSVSTSSDSGTPARYVAVDPAVKGALGTRVRTLEILGVATRAPEPLDGVAALHVTAGQDDVVVDVRVANAGSAPQTADVTLSGATATVSEPITRSIPAGDVVTLPFDVTFGDAVGHGKLLANATAGPSLAAQRFLAYVADAPLELLVDPDNQTPAVVVPGRQVSFSQFLAVRGGEDAPAIDIDPVLSEYRFADDALRAPLGVALHLEAGHGLWLPPTAPVTVPALADGPYGGVLHLQGVDAHGAIVSTDLPLRSGSLTVDGLAPIADIVLSAPGDAAAYGDQIDLSGTVADRDGPCGECVLDDARLQAFDADGQLLGERPIDRELDEGGIAGHSEGWSNDDGSIGGSITVVEGEWPEATVSTRFVANVIDDVGNEAGTISSRLTMDLHPPAITGASTVDVHTVVVQLTEPVSAPAGFAPGDWACDGVPVASAASETDTIVLGTGTELDRNATPSCAYDPVGPRAHDGAGYELADSSVTAHDGIAPLAPTVDAPEFTNTSTPTLGITDVEAGDTVAVFDDGFVVGSGTSDGSTFGITTDSLGTSDREVTLVARSTDAAGNVGPETEVTLTLDFTAPTLASASVTRTAGSRDLTLTFPEPLVGPAAANDWAAYTGAQPYTVSVVRSGVTVTLTVSDSRFQPATMTIDGVGYDVFAANGSTRLTDRAGNWLADSFRSV